MSKVLSSYSYQFFNSELRQEVTMPLKERKKMKLEDFEVLFVQELLDPSRAIVIEF